MSSLLDRLNRQKDLLKTVDVTRTKEDGSVVVERRNDDGDFEEVVTEETSVASCSNDDDNAAVSRRRQKKVERRRRMGFVVDLKPDLQLAAVTPNLFLGSQDVAAEFERLRRAGVTHVVNAAAGVRNYFPSKFTYLTVQLLDTPESDATPHFQTVCDFIDGAIRSGGKVLVHCNAGISRASTLLCAHLIKSNGMTLQDALHLCRSVRPAVCPNAGFMQQLRAWEKRSLS